MVTQGAQSWLSQAAAQVTFRQFVASLSAVLGLGWPERRQLLVGSVPTQAREKEPRVSFFFLLGETGIFAFDP